MNVEVHCYSGHTYAERPDWFRWEGTDHKVQEVVREWREPGERHFRVRTKDNRLCELCYDNQTDKWKIHPRAETRPYACARNVGEYQIPEREPA